MATKDTDQLTRVSVDHALYGYRRGHELLASSADLRPESRASLLVFTDMSGPSLVPGFESYLTGVPLPADDAYAFARTWYAPEMPRPGCVWTHVLLIKRSELAKLRDLGELRALFHRPQTADLELLEFYGKPSCLANSAAPRNAAPISSSNAEGILDAFYTSSLPLMIASSKPSEYEDLVMAFWSHLGLRARFAFSFCTGSMSIRKFKGENLVFQVIAPEVRRQVDRDKAEAFVLELDESQMHPEWARSLAREMAQKVSGRMGALIRSLDLDIGDRHILPMIAPLMAIDEHRNASESVQAIVKAVAAAWPSPKEGIAGKRTLLGETRVLSKVLETDITDAALLQALSRCSTTGAFDSSDLHLRERGRALWKSEGQAARELARDLLNGEGNELGDEILSGLMEAMPDSELWALAERNSALVLALLRRDAALAQSPRLWKLSKLRVTDVLDAVERTTHDNLPGIVHAALESGRFDAASHMLERYGSPIASAVLEWFAKGGDITDDVSTEFIKALGKHHEIAMNMLHQRTLRPEVAALALYAIGHEQIGKLPIALLSEILSAGFGRLADTIGADVAAMLLARGLKTADGGEKLVVATFTLVHHALAESRVSYQAWRPLDRMLPSLSWRDWDKCERLRRGLIDAIESNQWPASLLFKAANDEGTFRLMLKTSRSSSGGRAFLRRAQMESDGNLITALQKKILRSEEDVD